PTASPTARWCSWSAIAARSSVIPFFERVPLISSKRADFEKFAEIVRAMAGGRHLAPAGFRDLLELALSMNGNGRFRRVDWGGFPLYTDKISDSRSRG